MDLDFEIILNNRMGTTNEDENPPSGGYYVPPEVWEYEEPKGNYMGSFNRPTAGPRTEKELPRGSHALQLYSLGTPNGNRVTVLLEALNLKYGLEYDAWFMNIMEGDQFTSGFVAANPNSKIPVLLHYLEPDEEPVRVFETSAIMLYLCETFDVDEAFLPPKNDSMRAECLSWLCWVHGSAPYLGGGFGHFFKYCPEYARTKYVIDRYTMEVKRQLSVLDRHLGGADGKGAKQFLCGDKVTISDMACVSWYGSIPYGDKAKKFLKVDEYKNIIAWEARMAVSGLTCFL